MLQQVEELRLPDITLIHMLIRPFCAVLCIHANTHYNNHFSSFIAPQPPPAPPFASVCQPSAVRYSLLASPPGRGEGKGAYTIRIVLIRHCRSVPYHPPHDAAVLPEETAEQSDSCKVCGARIVHNELSALPHFASLSLSHT